MGIGLHEELVVQDIVSVKVLKSLWLILFRHFSKISRSHDFMTCNGFPVDMLLCLFSQSLLQFDIYIRSRTDYTSIEVL